MQRKRRYFYLWMLVPSLWVLPFVTLASANDSIKVERLLQEATRLPADSSRTLFFAQKMMGVPYVANTLDMADEEKLIVQLDKGDCTTFVETVLALSLTDKEGKTDFGSFKEALQRIRYREGQLKGYASRLHYFSDWIKDNEKKGIVRERTQEIQISTLQVLQLDFMSTHRDNYRLLRNNLLLTAQIAEIEKAWKDVSVSYIPKACLNASFEKLGIKNGDILAITTNTKGLDVVHTGFAIWMGSKLHLLHASSAMKKVILDPQPLFDYSKNKKAHTGVRVVSFIYKE